MNLKATFILVIYLVSMNATRKYFSLFPDKYLFFTEKRARSSRGALCSIHRGYKDIDSK
jgi:hypothetical protein